VRLSLHCVPGAVLGIDGGWSGVASSAPRFPGEVEVACSHLRFPSFGDAGEASTSKETGQQGIYFASMARRLAKRVQESRRPAEDGPEADVFGWTAQCMRSSSLQ
jgi:hypothetical protein